MINNLIVFYIREIGILFDEKYNINDVITVKSLIIKKKKKIYD